jgi:ABC-type uncharacterized transport system involved in gliding motility auxiliary subunit
MIADNFVMADECFRATGITDELRPASIKKYTGSPGAFLAIIGPKNFPELTNRDFDQFINGGGALLNPTTLLSY